VLSGKLFDELGSLVNIIAHKRSMGFSSAPSASRLAPSCIHMCMRAWWYSSSLWVTAAILTSSGLSAQMRESRYNWARPICHMKCVSCTYRSTVMCA
jgi:hypothetical protein